MLILAADTSTNAGSVALVDGERVLVERCWDLSGGPHGTRRLGAPNHSDRIVPEIESALSAVGVGYPDLQGLACAVGPGSFTGLRVALSALKGIAASRGLPLAGVSTLETLASNVPFTDRVVVPLLDARKGEIYAAAFEWKEGTMSRVMEDSVGPVGTLLAPLAGRPVLLAGGGFEAHLAAVTAALGTAPPQLTGSAALPRAGVVARLALPALAGPEPPEAATLAPRYLRRPEAEWRTAG